MNNIMIMCIYMSVLQLSGCNFWQLKDLVDVNVEGSSDPLRFNKAINSFVHHTRAFWQCFSSVS